MHSAMNDKFSQVQTEAVAYAAVFVFLGGKLNVEG